MSIVSGLYAMVQNRQAVQQWTINHIATNGKYVASNTAKGNVRLPGTRDWTGTFRSLSPLNGVWPGERFSFRGDAGRNLAHGSQHWQYFGDAIVASMSVQWNWNTGAPLIFTYNFSGDGPLDQESAAPITDSSDEVGHSAFENFWYVGDDQTSGSVSTEKLCAESATLTISSALVEYVDSCSGSYKRRLAGPIDWNAQVVANGNDQLAFWKNNDFLSDPVAITAVVVDPDVFFQLKWGRVAGFTNLDVNAETGAVVKQTSNIEMTARNTDGELGSIIVPQGAGVGLWFPNNMNLALTE